MFRSPCLLFRGGCHGWFSVLSSWHTAYLSFSSRLTHFPISSYPASLPIPLSTPPTPPPPPCTISATDPPRPPGAPPCAGPAIPVETTPERAPAQRRRGLKRIVAVAAVPPPPRHSHPIFRPPLISFPRVANRLPSASTACARACAGTGAVDRDSATDVVVSLRSSKPPPPPPWLWMGSEALGRGRLCGPGGGGK